MKASVSIIISTRNRARALQKTLQAFGVISVPADWDAELIVVDNGSQDNTAEVVQSAQLKSLDLRYLVEKKPGKSNALNTGMAAARGGVFVFTDDDVAPAKDWLEKIVTPILERQCEGTAGNIQLGAELFRPWMGEAHKKALSACGSPDEPVRELIGANMAISRSVFERIPGFDPELGPGASGFGEETLLSWQMAEAGFRLKSAPDAVVVHTPDSDRLVRADWLKAAVSRGRSQAYLMHHWQHREVKNPLARQCTLKIKLLLRRALQPPPALDAEGCPEWEMSYVAEIEMCRKFVEECKRSRNYARHGLLKKYMDALFAAGSRPSAISPDKGRAAVAPARSAN